MLQNDSYRYVCWLGTKTFSLSSCCDLKPSNGNQIMNKLLSLLFYELHSSFSSFFSFILFILLRLLSRLLRRLLLLHLPIINNLKRKKMDTVKVSYKMFDTWIPILIHIIEVLYGYNCYQTVWKGQGWN